MCPPFFRIIIAQSKIYQKLTCEFAGIHIWYSVEASKDREYMEACYRLRIPYELISPRRLDTDKAFAFYIFYLSIIQDENSYPKCEEIHTLAENPGKWAGELFHFGSQRYSGIKAV